MIFLSVALPAIVNRWANIIIAAVYIPFTLFNLAGEAWMHMLFGSMWHLPVLMNGCNYPENPIVGSFILFPIRLIATSYFYAWLTLKSKSIIPASIAHGAGNGIQEAIVSNVKMDRGQIYENAITIVVTVIVGLIVLSLSQKENVQQNQTDRQN